MSAGLLIESFDLDRYLPYDELTTRLLAYQQAFPGLCRIEEIGRSAEGRPMWGVTLSNRAAGPDGEKPGYLIDANVHAGELTGSACAMYSIHRLLTEYGRDPVATELLDTRAFYVVPRIAVDGAEVYLRTPAFLRSSPKLYPREERLPGLYAQDLNGDGHIGMMRIADPDGDWKAAEQDPRILVRRRPEDRGPGPYFKMLPEGLIHQWDGKGFPEVRWPWGLDFNRNYPAFWNPEGRQPGAGRYPLSEPETRAVADFLLSHPNIGAYVSYHTTGCILLRPPSNGADDKMDQSDLELFRRIGEMCTRITGYPCKSTYDAFAYPGQEALVKGADDWAYEHHGIQAFTCELWSIDVRSGGKSYSEVGVKGLLAMTDEEILENELKRMAYNEERFGGRGFLPWEPYLHPQLGPVEIGGWELKRCLQNPPEGPILLEEIRRVAEFAHRHALATPRLDLDLRAERLGAGGAGTEHGQEGLYRLSARVLNTGGLPTYVTEQALLMKAARPVEVRLELPEEAQLVSGRAQQEVRHLAGWLGGTANGHDVWVDWIIRARAATCIEVSAHTPRAGFVRTACEL